MQWHIKGRWLVSTPLMLMVPWMVITKDHPQNSAESEIEMPGAIDPLQPGNLGPATNQVLPKRSVDAVVSPNVLVNGRDLCPSGRGVIQSETSIAAYGNVLVAAFNDSRGVCSPPYDDHAAVGWAYSLDNGNTWTDGGGLPNSRNLNNGDPWLSVSPDGIFFLSGLWNGYQGFGFYRGFPTPDGIIWDTPTVVSFPPNATHDKEATTVDPITGRIYLTYTRFGSPGSGIYSSHSDDYGYNWSPQVAVFVGGSQGSNPVVDQVGDLLVTYQASGQMHIAKSTDGGATFRRTGTFSYSTSAVQYMDRSSDFPQIAVDRSGGAYDGFIYAVWHNGPGNSSRPMITHSENNGETWSTPIPVNTDSVSAAHWWPSVSVDVYGIVNVIYLDRRNNPGTGLTDLFLSQSYDGGATFYDIQVTDVTSSWQGIRTDPGFTFAGDYLRGITQGGDLLATWPDPRNGDPDVYFARINLFALAARNNKR